jgi:ubiquinone/menaquinone biosynthesis C-methylase UbiE
VLDYSRYLLEVGKKQAERQGLKPIFIQGDARNIGLRDQSFQLIMIMASSFGYFINEPENNKILDEAFRLLQPNGTLLLDLPNRDYVLTNFKPTSSHQINDDILVSRERELGDDIIFSRETVTSAQHGHIRTKTYCTRLYRPEKISALLSRVGFSKITCERDFMNRGTIGDFGCMTNRMIVTAKRV